LPRWACNAVPGGQESAQLSKFTAQAATALPGPGWLRDRRLAAFERFEAANLPTEAEEVWRYSRIDELDLDRFDPPPAEPAASLDPLPGPLRSLLDAVGPRAGVVVVRNGRIVLAELEPGLAERGVVVGSAAGVPDAADLMGEASEPAPDAYVELATAFAADPVLVRVPAGLAVERPVVVLHWADAEGGATFPRTLVAAGEASQVAVVEHIASAAGPALVVPVVELDVADAANLSYVAVQEVSTQAWYIGYQASRVGQAATLSSFAAAFGGEYARVRTDSRLVGRGGTSNLLAAYFGDGEQMHDFRTMQDHVAPKTTSDLLFKGAVEGLARSVYTGLIRVRKGAAGTNAFQTNRNLVLSEGARANSVPNLEIDENDVSCSHASAVGPIDEEQRYYLESRGIPREVADRLIVLGFFEDILSRTPVPGVAPVLRTAVAGKLAHTALGVGP
jgi:Fe-S cluster assembly protein SufD